MRSFRSHNKLNKFNIYIPLFDSARIYIARFNDGSVIKDEGKERRLAKRRKPQSRNYIWKDVIGRAYICIFFGLLAARCSHMPTCQRRIIISYFTIRSDFFI